MANFEAGTAYVGLVPSAKGFSKEAKKALAAAGDLNKQVDLEADTKQLEQAIREVKAHLKALDREKASPSIDFDKSVAEARIAEVQAKLEELGRKEATPRVNVDIARARQELNTLERQLEQINARRAEVNVDADISQAQTALASLEAKLSEVGRQKTEPKVTADTSTAQQRLTELDGRLAALAGKRVEPKVELAIAQAQQEALRIRAELERLGAMSPNVQVTADIASASAKLAAINAQLNQLDGRTANVNINSMSASQTTLILMGVVAALGAIGAAAPAAVAALAAVGGAVGGIGQGVGAALMGFSGIGDALKALEQDEKSAATSSSASSSQRAAGAKQVESAQRALQQAQVSADRAAITGAQQVQDAQRSLQQASVSAARAQIQAQEQVAAARRQVADAAVAAAQRVQSAEASLASAQRSRQYAQESLTRATQDAIRANRDLQMSVSGAALSEERASLSLAQARERLAKSTSTNPLERADLELSVREAEQQLKETQVRYGDLRSEQSQWAKSGVQGSQQVVAAQRALQDANRGVADAQRGLTDAQVSGARQVADAQASLAKAQRDAAWQQQDAQRAVADAQRGVSRAVQQAGWQQQDAARQVADAQRALAESYVQGGETASASSKKAALALAELTPAGRSMVSFLKSEWQPTWKRTSDAVADVMLPKVERSLRNLLSLEPLVRAGLVDAGSVIGDLAVKGSQLATSPAFRQDFATIMASNNRQLENYGDASISLFGAFTDLYSVAGPVSERFSRLVANSMEAFESFIIGKRATGELEEYLQQATDALMFIGGWLVDVSVDVYQLATALAPLGVGLLEVVRYITDLVAWAAQLSPGLTSISAAALIGAIALSKFGKAIAVGGAITNTVAGVRTAAGALTTVFNPATLAATGAMQRFGDHSTTAAKKIGLSEGAASKFGSAARGLGSVLPVAGAAVVGLALATDALTASASEAAAGLEKGGTAAAQMRQQIAEQNGVVGEGATGIDRFNQSVNEWIGSTTGLWATQQTANEELERSRAAMTNLERAQSLATEAQGNYEQALRDFGAASPEATAALQQLEARSKDVEIAQIAVREKTDLATAAMIWQRDEQLASLDANLRKRQADSQLADAQQRLADTIRDHGAGSREAASAQLDLEMAQSRAAAAAKESAGGQQAYNAAIGKMVADTKGPLSETLVGLVRTLDGAGLAAAGAKVQINDAGVAVATFPNGKTVTLDAQNAPTFFTNLQAAKAAVDSTKGTIGVDADPGVGVQKLGNFKLAVDQTTGVVKMDGDISPADADRLGIKAKTDGTTGTMWINGNPVNCDGSLNGMRVKVDQTTGVMTIDGDPTKANQKGQAAKDGISNPATQPVITPRVDPDPALDALKTWWGKVQEWFGRNPITPAGPAPNHTGVQNPNRGRYAAGGLVEGYAAGGAISHKQVIRGYPTGGRVRGPGTATSDSIPAMLSNGEYVIRASSVAKLGVPLLNQLNAFAAGGPVGLAGGGMPSAGASVSSAAVAVPSGDPRATAASAAATSMLAQSMEAAASAAGVLRPSLAGVQAGQRALVSAGVAPLAGAITGPLNAALGLYQRQVGVQVPAANAALQGAQALTRASTAVTAANTAAASAQMAGAVTGMSAQAQAQHAGLRAGQAATQVSTNQTAANTAVNSAGMSSSVTGMSAVSQAQHSFLRQSQGQTVVANNTLAANTTMNTGRMSGDNAVMSATVQGHLQNVRGSQGTTVASTTAFADAWRAQLARTQPDSANPLRWVINFPIRSVTDAWNNLDAQFALGKKVNPYIPNFATGGLLRGPGTGTSDSILGLNAGGVPTARVSNGEFVVREAVTKRALPFLSALNRGDGEALQAAGALQRVTPKSFRGRSGFDQNLPPGFAAGGPVEQRIAAAKQWLSTEARGARYVYGGGTNPRAGMDCSSMVSAVTHILSGRPANSGRIGTTATMPWGGFAPGLRSAWSVGNKPSDHMAGTLAGQNVEQHGPNGTPFTFPSRWGADNGYFNQQWHLPVVGGQFVSGGAGGGGYDPTPAVNEAFAKAYREVADVTRFFGSSPQVVRDQGVARFSADKVKAHALDKLTAMFAMSMGGVDISGISGAVVDQVKQVAARFGGWDKGPQWDNGIFPLVAKESSWNPNAANSTSSARGLFQKMTSLYGPVEPTPAGQANWGLGYIRDRYGDPMKAWAFHRARGYYDKGGMLGPGEIGVNATRYPERVLDNVETKSYDTLTRLVGKNGVQLTVADPGSNGPTIGTLNAVVPQGATVNDMARAVSFEMRRTKRGGVYARG